MKSLVKVFSILSVITLCVCITGCQKVSDTEQSKASTESDVDSAQTTSEDNKNNEFYDFLNTYSYDNFKITTDKGDEYYNYGGDCVVISAEDEAKRVIRNDIVYMVAYDQYWVTNYDFDDNPYDIETVLGVDMSKKYIEHGGWYFEDYTGKNENAVNLKKYKIKDNTVTVANIEYIDHDKEPFDNKVIDSTIYTVEELKDKSDMPEINLNMMEEVIVEEDDNETYEDEYTDDEFEEISEESIDDEIDDGEIDVSDRDSIEDIDIPEGVLSDN